VGRRAVVDVTDRRPGVEHNWVRGDAVYRRGICPVCKTERRVKKDGTMGGHRTVLGPRYRGQQCAGVDELPLRITHQGRGDTGA
jgi:hypothetical protein